MSREDRRPAAPKPYGFVPIAAPRKDKTVGHEQILGEGYASGRLTYQLRALTPVFVASGAYALGEDVGYEDAPVVRACYRVDGVPAIPGSSLKGVVRSVAEAVSPSCVTVTRLDRRLIPHQPRRRDECEPKRACPACSIFGRMGRMSKVFFADARMARGRTQLYHLPALYAPRAHRARATYQTRAGKFKGRKFYFHGRPAQDPRQPPVEVIVRGSLMRGTIDFENLSDAELGLLFFALGLDGSIVLKLGGGKPSCLGSLQMEPGQVEVLASGHFVQAEPAVEMYEGDDLLAFIAATMQQAIESRLILREQSAALCRILGRHHLDERECPAGMY
jgi:hypothetical protein